MPRPNLAILYWFYKEPEITKNHLEILKRHNPDRKIYGLYGGDKQKKTLFLDSLSDLLDDFWEYPGTYGDDSYTKWIHGDLLLLDWYDKRGRDLEWESIAITQWDMLIFDDILNILPGLQKNQLYFAGYRSINDKIENRWKWTKPEGEYRHDYDTFRKYVDERFGWHEPVKVCLYIFEVLNRKFFDRSLEIEDKKIGMLEYKNPTLAAAWGLDIYEKDLGVFWQDWYTMDTAALIAIGNAFVSDDFVKEQIGRSGGWRMFHPNLSKW